MVRVKLHAYGEGMHLLPRDSERALTPAFVRVAHVAIREKRVLTRDDFRTLFDDSTRINVPLSQFNQRQAALSIGLQPASPATSEVNYSVVQTNAIPDLPVPCAERMSLVDSLGTCIAEHRFVAIQGSTGMGKSTIAKLLARRLGGNWCWISFAGWKAERVSAELQWLARQAAAFAQPMSVLADDFNPSGAYSALLLQQLAVLSRLVLMHGGRMIVTTQKLLGEGFLRQSDLSALREEQEFLNKKNKRQTALKA